MRPYLAVVKDSFREAFASRVLWVLLLLITVALGGLAPFTWYPTVASRLQPGDIRNVHGLALQLKDGSQSGSTPLQAYLWNSLTAATQRRINELDEEDRRVFGLTRALIDDLNTLIEQADFFRPELEKGALGFRGSPPGES